MRAGSFFHNRVIYDYLLLTVVALVFAIPCILFGIPFGHDTIEHVLAYKEFLRQLAGGELYPRWLTGLNEGLGSPFFFVYPPLGFYIASAIHGITSVFGVQLNEIRELGLSLELGLAASGWTSYIWLKGRIQDRRIAIAGAIFYMAAPYHLMVELYIRAALPEYWAMVFVPLVLHFAAGVALRRRHSQIGLALSYALLITAHLFVALMFCLVATLYAATVAKHDERMRTMFRLIPAMVLGLAISGIYLFTAIEQQRHISADFRTTYPEWFYRNNFLFVNRLLFAWPHTSAERFPWYLSWLLLESIALACFTLVMSRGIPMAARKERLYWITCCAVSAVLSWPITLAIWEALPLLQKIEFPWRLQTVFTTGAAALLCLGLCGLRKRRTMAQNMAVTAAALVAATWILPTAKALKVAYSAHWRELSRSTAVVENLGEPNVDVLRFAWARWTDPEFLTPQAIQRTRTEPYVRVVRGRADFAVESRSPRHIRLRIDSPDEQVVLNVKQFYYPGWEAHDAGDKSRYAVSPSNPKGWITVLARGGHRDIDLLLPSTAAEKAGTLSSITGLLIGGWLLAGRRRQASATDGESVTGNGRTGPGTAGALG
jgi:hypothetical protein